MSKCLLPILISLTFIFVFYPSKSIHKSGIPNAFPTVTPIPSDQNTPEIITLDKYSVCNDCQPGYPSRDVPGCDGDPLIIVSADKVDGKFKYKYTTSGGQIIGEGAKVYWDMTGAPPGTYRIKVEIEDKSTGQIQTGNQTITVKEKICIIDCICPTLAIDAPKTPIKAGEMMTFTANVSGGSGETVTYNWTVSDGEIIEGQETPVIKVATNSKMAGKVVKATLEIGGVCESCQRTAEANGSIAKPKRDKE